MIRSLTLNYYLLTRAIYAMKFMEKKHKKMYKYKELFDLSNLLLSSKYYCSDNEKVLGKMKDEYGGKSILKFVGLKSQIY